MNSSSSVRRGGRLRRRTEVHAARCARREAASPCDRRARSDALRPSDAPSSWEAPQGRRSPDVTPTNAQVVDRSDAPAAPTPPCRAGSSVARHPAGPPDEPGGPDGRTGGVIDCSGLETRRRLARRRRASGARAPRSHGAASGAVAVLAIVVLAVVLAPREPGGVLAATGTPGVSASAGGGGSPSPEPTLTATATLTRVRRRPRRKSRRRVAVAHRHAWSHADPHRATDTHTRPGEHRGPRPRRRRSPPRRPPHRRPPSASAAPPPSPSSSAPTPTDSPSLTPSSPGPSATSPGPRIGAGSAFVGSRRLVWRAAAILPRPCQVAHDRARKKRGIFRLFGEMGFALLVTTLIGALGGRWADGVRQPPPPRSADFWSVRGQGRGSCSTS